MQYAKNLLKSVQADICGTIDTYDCPSWCVQSRSTPDGRTGGPCPSPEICGNVIWQVVRKELRDSNIKEQGHTIILLWLMPYDFTCQGHEPHPIMS